LKKKRILVTGGAGFIGGHLIDRLVQLGHEVWAIDNESTGSPKNVNQKANYIKGDVTDPVCLERAFLKGLDAVFHVAGQASTSKSFLSPEIDLETNVNGALRVVQKCLQHRVPRLLYASSMTVYGNPKMVPVGEEANCEPISYYGITKYAAERYIHATAERNDLDFNFQVTSFRMFNVYGERQSLTNPYQGVVGIFIGNVLRSEPITIHSDGEQSRDFVHIDDVVEVWMLALDNPKAYNQVFNIGTGVNCSINGLVQIVKDAAGDLAKRSEIRMSPMKPGDQRCMIANIDKIRNALGWQPHILFAEGMTRTVNWALANAQSMDKQSETYEIRRLPFGYKGFI
jgi:UDP-glucose 4-epimerase